MTEREELLGLLDDLAKLLERSSATTIEVSSDEVSVTVRRSAAAVPPSETPQRRERDAVAEVEKVQRVHATTVGIFSATKEWKRGDKVTRGTTLGAIQSLGHMADIAAPADGTIDEVLVAIGAPVEYGQVLFSITLE